MICHKEKAADELAILVATGGNTAWTKKAQSWDGKNTPC